MIPLAKNYWARLDEKGELRIPTEFPIQMAHSDGRGIPLVSHDNFGADMIMFEAGKGVRNHTHPGAHILIVYTGFGILGYYDQQIRLEPGLIYMIPGNVPHSIDAETDLVLMAVGNDHRQLDSTERLKIVEEPELTSSANQSM
jgi:quercetin dioxygenase-like cupin family protein